MTNSTNPFIQQINELENDQRISEKTDGNWTAFSTEQMNGADEWLKAANSTLELI